MRLNVKNMMCLHCKLIVKLELRKLGLPYVLIGLGLIELFGDVTEKQLDQLKISLHRSGLELQNDRKNILTERIKDLIDQMINGLEMINRLEEPSKTNYSDYISEKLHYDYTYLSNIFSSIKGITIQHFIIIHKVAKAKELLLNNAMSITEISYRLHYSSVAHLSNQFKKITGHSPSFYKNMNHKQVQRLETSFA